jgi:Protein of unknown function (DUF1194)
VTLRALAECQACWPRSVAFSAGGDGGRRSPEHSSRKPRTGFSAHEATASLLETPDFEHVLVNSAAVLKKYPFRLLTQAEYGNNTMRVMRTFLVVALMATAGWIPAFATERVDLLLVLAADSSRSVDAVKFQLQRSGYAAAFSNPRVIDAIRGGPSRRIGGLRRHGRNASNVLHFPVDRKISVIFTPFIHLSLGVTAASGCKSRKAVA